MSISNFIYDYYWVAVFGLLLISGFADMRFDEVSDQQEELKKRLEEEPVSNITAAENSVEKRIDKGIQVIRDSTIVLKKHPHFLVPLLLFWVFYASTVLYLDYFFDWSPYTWEQFLLILFGYIFVLAFLLAFSATVLLELIEQHERGRKQSFGKAVKDTFIHNTIRIIPIVFVWTIIWFILTVIKILTSKSQKDGEREFTPENAAQTVAGYQKLSFSLLAIDAIQKGLRMLVFLMLPAIAWEGKNTFEAVKKGLAIFKANLGQFATGYSLTYLAGVVIFIPPAIIFFLAGELEIVFPDYVWYLTVVYVGLGWSYVIYLEQFFVAELYLWNKKWEVEVEKAKKEGKKIPTLLQVPRPSVLDEICEFDTK